MAPSKCTANGLYSEEEGEKKKHSNSIIMFKLRKQSAQASPVPPASWSSDMDGKEDFLSWNPNAVVRQLEMSCLAQVPVVLRHIVTQYLRPAYIVQSTPSLVSHISDDAPRHLHSLVLPAAIARMRVSVYWRDQGWGNRKGKISLRLMRQASLLSTGVAAAAGSLTKEDTPPAQVIQQDEEEQEQHQQAKKEEEENREQLTVAHEEPFGLAPPVLTHCMFDLCSVDGCRASPRH
jgi:hypothetical protein